MSTIESSEAISIYAEKSQARFELDTSLTLSMTSSTLFLSITYNPMKLLYSLNKILSPKCLYK